MSLPQPDYARCARLVNEHIHYEDVGPEARTVAYALLAIAAAVKELSDGQPIEHWERDFQQAITSIRRSDNGNHHNEERPDVSARGSRRGLHQEPQGQAHRQGASVEGESQVKIQMTPSEALEWLVLDVDGTVVRTGNERGSALYSPFQGSKYAELRGNFSADELEALAVYMRSTQK